MSEEQRRVILWVAPRSVSTAFLRAFMNRSSTKTLNEPYSPAFYFGPERGSSRFDGNAKSAEEKECCFKDIKEELEKPYPGYECVFVKDSARSFAHRPHPLDDIPQGYAHTFLIRDPHKSVASFYKTASNLGDGEWGEFRTEDIGVKELYNLYMLVTTQLGQDTIIVDADDLCKNPDTMLRMYCEKVGIDYQSSMVEWEEPKDLTGFQKFRPFFERALTSKSFEYADIAPKQVVEDLPDYVRQAINDNMGYYNEMYEKRLRP